MRRTASQLTSDLTSELRMAEDGTVKMASHVLRICRNPLVKAGKKQVAERQHLEQKISFGSCLFQCFQDFAVNDTKVVDQALQVFNF